MTSLLAQSINLFAVVLLVLAFAMIAQRRILTLIHLFTLQGAALAAATLIVAYLTGQHHLYYSAVLTFVLKVILIPILLHRAIGRLNVRWDVETLFNVPTTMLIGIVLVIVAFNLAAPTTRLKRVLIVHLASPISGDVQVRITSSNQRVEIDALGLSQR